MQLHYDIIKKAVSVIILSSQKKGTGFRNYEADEIEEYLNNFLMRITYSQIL